MNRIALVAASVLVAIGVGAKMAISTDRQAVVSRAIQGLLSDPIAIAAESNETDAARVIAVRALVLTITAHEGTYDPRLSTQSCGDIDPYHVIFSCQEAPDLSAHPEQCIPISGTNQCSDAAGLAQFISTTYYGVLDAHPTICPDRSFSPECQDNAFVALLLDSSSYGGNETPIDALLSGVSVESGRVVVSEDSVRRAVESAAWQWASFRKSDGTAIGDATGQNAYPTEVSVSDFYEILNLIQSEVNHE